MTHDVDHFVSTTDQKMLENYPQSVVPVRDLCRPYRLSWVSPKIFSHILTIFIIQRFLAIFSKIAVMIFGFAVKIGFQQNYFRLLVNNGLKPCLQIYKIKEVTPLSLKKSAEIFFKDRQSLICVDITHPSDMGGYKDVFHLPQGVILR